MVRERTKKKETRRRGHPLESRNGRSDQSASFLVLIEAVESKLTGIVLLIVRWRERAARSNESGGS